MLELDPSVFTFSDRISETAKTLSPEQKLERVLAYFKRERKWPHCKHEEDGFKIGRYWDNNCRKPSRLSVDDKKRILDLDPTAFSK